MTTIPAEAMPPEASYLFINTANFIILSLAFVSQLLLGLYFIREFKKTRKKIYSAVGFFMILNFIVCIFLAIGYSPFLLALVPFFLVPFSILFSGIYFLIEFKKNRRKKYAIIGLVLTFLLIGIICLAVFRSQESMTYI